MGNLKASDTGKDYFGWRIIAMQPKNEKSRVPIEASARYNEIRRMLFS